MLVKVYKGNGFSRRAGMHRLMRFWRARIRALRAPAASALRRGQASVAYAPMVFGIILECRSASLRNERSASPESPEHLSEGKIDASVARQRILPVLERSDPVMDETRGTAPHRDVAVFEE